MTTTRSRWASPAAYLPAQGSSYRYRPPSVPLPEVRFTPLPARKQVPWWLSALSSLGNVFLACGWVLGFVLGAFWVADRMEAVDLLGLYPMAFIVYGVGFAWLSRRLKL